MPRLRCPACRSKFDTSKSEGRVRCPECEELFEPDWDDVRDAEPKRRRDEDEDDVRDDEPRRKRTVKRPQRRGSGSSNTAVIVAGLIFFLLFLAGVGYGVYRAFGRSPEFTTFSPPGGRCSVLMPGTPSMQEQNVLGMQMRMYTIDRSAGSWALSWADAPQGTPLSLRGAVDGIATALDGQIKSIDSKGDLGANGFIEFEMVTDRPKGYASGRVMLAYGRFYQVIAAGSNAKLSNPDVRKFIDSFKLTDGDFPWNSNDARPLAKNNNPLPGPGPKINPKKNTPKGDGWAPDPKDVNVAKEEILGVDFDPKKTDTAPAGSVLVGLEVGLAPFFDYNIVGTLRPIYRSGKSDRSGEHYGLDEKNGVVKLLAKPGYAIGAITAKTGLGIDGVSVTFMRINGNRLDPDDAYESEWVGGMGGGGPRKITGDGAPATGLIVREGKERVSAVGLIFK